MDLYFRIDDALDKIGQADGALRTLVRVEADSEVCLGPREDVFVLSSTPKLLNLGDPAESWMLADLLEKSPLYEINVQLVIDEALTERHKDSVIAAAITEAFAPHALPSTLSLDEAANDTLAGGLRHPMLGHMAKTDLAAIYIRFLKALNRTDPRYGFGPNILGRHPERFTDLFNGFFLGDGGQVRADILVAFGMRMGIEKGLTAENAAHRGRFMAQKAAIEELRELLWAWLEADAFQMRRCQDLVRVLELEGLPKIPNWARQDAMTLLEREAMKQLFAAAFIRQNPGAGALAETPALQKAVQASAANETDPALARFALSFQEQTDAAQAIEDAAQAIEKAETFMKNAQARANDARKTTL